MIQEIEILNFKSFLQEKISQLSEQVNLILGQNGQGKSNIYSALKFCLSLESKDQISEEHKRGILNVV